MALMITSYSGSFFSRTLPARWFGRVQIPDPHAYGLMFDGWMQRVPERYSKLLIRAEDSSCSVANSTSISTAKITSQKVPCLHQHCLGGSTKF